MGNGGPRPLTRVIPRDNLSANMRSMDSSPSRPIPVAKLPTDRCVPSRGSSTMSTQQRQRNGGLGGLRVAATHDPSMYTAAARGTLASSFHAGHARSVCPGEIVIPEGLTLEEHDRRVKALRQLHSGRLAARSARARAPRRHLTRALAPARQSLDLDQLTTGPLSRPVRALAPARQSFEQSRPRLCPR